MQEEEPWKHFKLAVVDGSTHMTYDVSSLRSSSSLTLTDLIRRRIFIGVAANTFIL